MRFVARKPREGINVSDEHPLVEAGTLVVALSLIFLGIAVALILFVEIFLMFVSAEDEAELFSEYSFIEFADGESQDARFDATNELLQGLAAHWPEAPYEFRLEIEPTSDPNAMALPGGLIIVTSGLLDRTETENELAFVLGHELGHFRNRDHIRSLGRGVVIGIAFGIIAGSDTLGVTVADLTLRGFSREQESDADEFGLSLVQAEYGHVNDSWGFFEQLIEAGEDSDGLMTFASTHPATEDRVCEIKDYARSNGWSLDGPLRELSE